MAALITVAICCQPLCAQFELERLDSNFTQPIYLAQPPGDDDNLFVVERGDSQSNLGRILVHNIVSANNFVFLDVPGGFFQDSGLLGLAFHPEFQTNGLFYITVAEGLDNRLDEYQANPSDYGQLPILTRRILQFDAIEGYHTINWCGFRPGTNELFVCCGDGGPQANDISTFDIPKIEDPESLFGKLVRLDVSETFLDAATDASHPGVTVMATGLRNPFRASFSPQGGMFIGDVGFVAVEEINYIPPSHFEGTHPPMDFGWVDREGTVPTFTFNPSISGVKGPEDIDPIFDYVHNGTNVGQIGFPHPSVIRGNSVTVGYMYFGRFFFADFINNTVFSGEFDEDLDPASFDGTNLTDIVNHTVAFEESVSDDIDFVSSFAMDNAGVMYLFDFGDGYFPPSGSGEIFRVLPVAGIVETNSDTAVSEAGVADSYNIVLPTEGNIEILAATASSEIEISNDNINFSSSTTISISPLTAPDIFVRAIDDSEGEDVELASIVHVVSGSTDPDYLPGLNVGQLEVRIGDDDGPSLVHRYTFNDGTADDSVSNSHGTLQGAAFVQDEQLHLNGGGWGDAFVDLPDSTASSAGLNGEFGSITVETWMTANSTSNWAAIFSFGNSGPGIEDGNGSDGHFWQLVPQNGSNGNLRSLTSVPFMEAVTDDNAVLPTNQEIHVVNALSTSENTNQIYINGELQATGPLPNGFDLTNFGVVGDIQNWIGRSQWFDPGLDAQINELRIYDKVLSGDEVAANFESGPTDSFLPGDVNCDGVVNLLDVEPFVTILVNGQFNEKADINFDGSVSLLDVAPFVAILSGN